MSHQSRFMSVMPEIQLWMYTEGAQWWPSSVAVCSRWPASAWSYERLVMAWHQVWGCRCSLRAWRHQRTQGMLRYCTVVQWILTRCW